MFLWEIGQQAAARDPAYFEFADADFPVVGRVVDEDGAVVGGDGELGIVTREYAPKHESWDFESVDRKV